MREDQRLQARVSCLVRGDDAGRRENRGVAAIVQLYARADGSRRPVDLRECGSDAPVERGNRIDFPANQGVERRGSAGGRHEPVEVGFNPGGVTSGGTCRAEVLRDHSGVVARQLGDLGVHTDRGTQQR
jgi:hypothetical protein